MLKKISIITGISIAIIALIAFNRLTSTRGKVILYAEADKNVFEMSIAI